MQQPLGVPTVCGIRAKYTKKQLLHADKAQWYLRCMAYPTVEAAIEQIKAMKNPTITSEDIKLAYEIYGKEVPAFRGNAVKRSTISASYNPINEDVIKEQMAEIDLFFIRSRVYMIMLLSPLEYSFVAPIPDKTVESVFEVIDAYIKESKSKGFNITYMRSDNERAFLTKRFTDRLAEAEIVQDTVAAGGHAPKAERRIRFVKEKARIIWHMLPYNPSAMIQDWLVMFANRVTNMQRASNSISTLTPREKFTGRQGDFRHVKAPFGSYVQCVVPNTNNTMEQRTEAGIALMPKDNLTGTWYIYKIQTGRIVSRDNFTVIPMPDKLVQHMNRLAIADGLKVIVPDTNDYTPDPAYDRLTLNQDAAQPVDITKRLNNVTEENKHVEIGGVDSNKKKIENNIILHENNPCSQENETELFHVDKETELVNADNVTLLI